MKYAMMSDAHSNPAALKTAYADACEQGCEKFVFLGDAGLCRHESYVGVATG